MDLNFSTAPCDAMSELKWRQHWNLFKYNTVSEEYEGLENSQFKNQVASVRNWKYISIELCCMLAFEF